MMIFHDTTKLPCASTMPLSPSSLHVRGDRCALEALRQLNTGLQSDIKQMSRIIYALASNLSSFGYQMACSEFLSCSNPANRFCWA